MRTGLGDTLPNKMLRLILKAGIEEIDFEKKFTAIKMHFGELGNMAYLRPGFPRIIAETVRKTEAFRFSPTAAHCTWETGNPRRNISIRRT